MVIYSHSRLSTFEQCPLKFKFRYIDKIKPDIKEGIEAFLGKIVHETLRFIYEESVKGREINLDETIEFYANLWNKEFNNEINIVKKENNPEHYFNQGVRFLINYFTENSPFKDNTIAVEKRIIIELEEGYKLQGYIDRLVHNPETNIYEIHDYKTNGFLKPQEELDKDRQLALYALGIKNIFPNIQDIHLIWHFLAFNKKMISKRTEQELEKLKQDIINLIDKIESTTEFNPNPSKLCKWCEFRSNCHLFNQKIDYKPEQKNYSLGSSEVSVSPEELE